MKADWISLSYHTSHREIEGFILCKIQKAFVYYIEYGSNGYYMPATELEIKNRVMRKKK